MSAASTATFLGQDALSLAVEETGPTVVLKMAGEVDLAAGQRIAAALDRICAGRLERLIVDLQRVTFLDAAGLRAILRANERGRERGFGFALVKPRGLASRIFTLTGLHRQLDMFDSLPTASQSP